MVIKRLVRPLLAVLVVVMATASLYVAAPAPAAPVTLGPVTDEWGVVRIPRGQPIIIAYWLVVSGPNASLGTDSRRGIELAIADKKTVAGHPIRLIGEDSGCNAEGGQTAATRIAANRQVAAAVGSSCSSEAIPGSPILCKVGIVTVSPSNTAPALTDPKRGPPARESHIPPPIPCSQKSPTVYATVTCSPEYGQNWLNRLSCLSKAERIGEKAGRFVQDGTAPDTARGRGIFPCLRLPWPGRGQLATASSAGSNTCGHRRSGAARPVPG